MILEVAILEVRTGSEQPFEVAFSPATATRFEAAPIRGG
jgi:hypothetical protein